MATLSHLDLLSIISKLLHYVACSLALCLPPNFSLFRSTKQNLCKFICLIRLDYFFACQLFRTAKSYFFAKNKLFTRNRSELRQSKYEPELARLGSSWRLEIFIQKLLQLRHNFSSCWTIEKMERENGIFPIISIIVDSPNWQQTDKTHSARCICCLVIVIIIYLFTCGIFVNAFGILLNAFRA